MSCLPLSPSGEPRVSEKDWDQRIPAQNLVERLNLGISRPFVDIAQPVSTTGNARLDRPVENWFDINTIYVAPLRRDSPYHYVDPIRNIPVESELVRPKRLDTDGIKQKDVSRLTRFNAAADDRLYRAMQPRNINTLKLWDTAGRL